ncbi:unnamed protein product [Brassica oleracea]
MGSVLFSFLQTKRSLMSLSSEDINVRLQELGSRVHNTTAGAGKDLVSSLVSVTMFYTRLKDQASMPYICVLSQTVNDSRVLLGRRWMARDGDGKGSR